MGAILVELLPFTFENFRFRLRQTTVIMVDCRHWDYENLSAAALNTPAMLTKALLSCRLLEIPEGKSSQTKVSCFWEPDEVLLLLPCLLLEP
jgi:hypothetical protein